MKRIAMIIMIAFISVMIITSFSFFGCRQEAVVTTAAEADVTEEAVADKNVIDPWIVEMRAGLDQFRGEIGYKGEYGHTPTWDTELYLTIAEVEKIRQGKEDGSKWKVAYVMDGSHADHTTALVKGMQDVLDHLNMELVSVVDPELDVTREKSGVESVLALDPDVVIGAPIDPVASAESFRPVIEAGKKFVIWSNIPQGYEYNKDFVGVSSAMAQDLGLFTVDILSEGITEPTKVAYLYFDAQFWVVNLIDGMVKQAIEDDPNLIIAEELGFSIPDDAFDLITAALQRDPEIKLIYGVWMVPATFAADACMQLKREDVKIACFGVDRPTLVSILTDGNIVGTVSDDPYHLGANLGLLAGYGAIDKTAPPFTITPAVPITADSLEEVWDITQKTPFPDEIAKLMQ